MAVWWRNKWGHGIIQICSIWIAAALWQRFYGLRESFSIYCNSIQSLKSAFLWQIFRSIINFNNQFTRVEYILTLRYLLHTIPTAKFWNRQKLKRQMLHPKVCFIGIFVPFKFEWADGIMLALIQLSLPSFKSV